MSLLDAFKAECVTLKRTQAADGEGGQVTKWADGTSFQAAITLSNSTKTTKAEKDVASNTYTVTTGKDIELKFHDVFRRVSDGRVFRVTSDGTDNKTPDVTTLDMRQVTAEEWMLT